jgi:hypothetical protein
MSTLTDSFAVMNGPRERRFYPRVAPSMLVRIAFGPGKQAMLLNVSENGLLISAPQGLSLNSVYRILLFLHDIPGEISVHARTIWTAAAQKIAGIQFFDLSDPDREQIRKWVELQSSKNDSFEFSSSREKGQASAIGRASVIPELEARPQFARTHTAPSSPDLSRPAQDDSSQDLSLRESASSNDAPAVRTTAQSSAPVLIFWSIALATIFLVTGWASGHNLSDKFLNRSLMDRSPSRTSPPATQTTKSSPTVAAQSANGTPVAAQPSASNPSSFPKTLSVDAAANQPSATGAAANYASSIPTQPNSTRANDVPPGKSTERTFMPAPGTVFPSASGTDSSANIPRASAPPPTKPNNPDANLESRSEVRSDVLHKAQPEPSTFELPASRSASFVNLPGERVLQSPGVTMHVQRSVWVRAGHWFWRGRKKGSLGALSSRVDPQPPRSSSPSGTIAVQAAIDEEGRITSLKPLYGSLAYLPSVSRAIRDWRFEPTYVDNRPVETLAKIEINFHSTSSRAYRP